MKKESRGQFRVIVLIAILFIVTGMALFKILFIGPLEKFLNRINGNYNTENTHKEIIIDPNLIVEFHNPEPERGNIDVLRAAEVGSRILFGEYEQDFDEATGKEVIEWLVLDKQEDRMLVISRYGLENQPYNIEDTDVTWETCSLREWLNRSFYETAFVPEEKGLILSSVVTADVNPMYDTPAGNDTTDNVFLLSIDEVNRYFELGGALLCVGTPYCFMEPYSDEGDEGESCHWWLRSPGINSSTAAVVNRNGWVSENGNYVNGDLIAVRPAMWIDLNP